MKIQLLTQNFAICKVSDLPINLIEKDFCFISKTDEEISVVCPLEQLPNNTINISKTWKSFRVVGNLDFSLVGILSNISHVLAKNNISIFAVSTYNTDYIFVKQESLQSAVVALQNEGYEIV